MAHPVTIFQAGPNNDLLTVFPKSRVYGGAGPRLFKIYSNGYFYAMLLVLHGRFARGLEPSRKNASAGWPFNWGPKTQATA
jgi:hypothetical protein